MGWKLEGRRDLSYPGHAWQTSCCGGTGYSILPLRGEIYFFFFPCCTPVRSWKLTSRRARLLIKHNICNAKSVINSQGKGGGGLLPLHAWQCTCWPLTRSLGEGFVLGTYKYAMHTPLNPYFFSNACEVLLGYCLLVWSSTTAAEWPEALVWAGDIPIRIPFSIALLDTNVHNVALCVIRLPFLKIGRNLMCRCNS